MKRKIVLLMELNRRNFLRSASLAALATTCGPAVAKNIAGRARPNVIFILADDMGPGDAGCYGGKIIPTPNIDRLAAEGMRFTNHYAGATVCGPSRSCLMIGQHTGHAFQRGNPGQVAKNSPLGKLKDKVGRKSDFPLRAKPGDRVTIAEVFKEAGYRTAIVGKWGLGNPGTPGDPLKVGFDEFFGLATHVDAHTYHPAKMWDNGKYVTNPGREHLHPQYTDRAIDFVKRHKEQPFFLYLAYQFPHGPYRARDSLRNEPFTAKHRLNGQGKVYASQIAQMDRSIGRIMQELGKLGLDRRTLVVFASDNGPGGRALDQLNSSGPFRGKKGDLYEGGIRTPMIARWPGRIQAGSTSDLVSVFWDFLPTVAELTGQPIPEQTDGVSLLPTLTGNPGRQKPREAIYFEWSRTDRAGQVVRKGHWKLIRWLNGKQPRLELFHLGKDIGEKDNLASDHAEKVRELTAIMDREHEANPHFPLPLIDPAPEMKAPGASVK
jgi:arylsulfatase A